jgi:FeS assembly SUF system regulator
MLRLSKKADYALLAMQELAANPHRPAMSARELAETTHISPDLLSKVLQQLVRAHLLASQQGTRGGYGLARDAATISVADVIQAIDGPLTVTACSLDDDSCDQYDTCNIRDPLWRIKDRIVAALEASSVAGLVEDMPPRPASMVPMRVVRNQP